MARPSDWAEVQKRWEAGDDVGQIAVACRRKRTEIEDTAARERWSNSRRPKQAGARKAKQKTSPTSLSESALAATAELRVEILDPDAYLEQHRDDFQGLRQMAMSLLPSVPLMAEQNQGKTLAAIGTALKLVQDGQRKALGVDKVGPTPPGGTGDAGDDEPAEPLDTSDMDPAELARRISSKIRGH